jgi:pilus assembly protein CpaF
MTLARRLAGVDRSPGRPAAKGAAPATPRPARTDPVTEVKRGVRRALVESLGPRLYDPHMTQTELESRVRQTLQTVTENEATPLSGQDRARVTQEVADDILGYGPLEPLLNDPDVTEVMVNGPERIFIERGGKLQRVDAVFSDEAHLRRTIEKIVAAVGRRVDESSPMADARLRDGSRVNVVVPPIALDGSSLTIRKFAPDPFTADDLVTFGTFTPLMRDFLDACVRGRLNILISGGTGSGKTTTSTSSRLRSLPTSGSSPSRTRPSCSCTRPTSCGSRPGHPTSRARGRSASATSCATRCGCGRTGSWSARSATPRRWTCCRR